MDIEEFNEKLKGILNEYNVCVETNCDLWCAVTGLNIYENDDNDEGDFIAEVTGIHYTSNGTLAGDFESFLELLDKTLKEYFKN